MVSLRSLRNMNAVEKLQKKRPILSNATRWNSVYKMCIRYLELFDEENPFLVQSKETQEAQEEPIVDLASKCTREVKAKLLAYSEVEALTELVKDLQYFYRISLNLQKQSSTLADARKWANQLAWKFPESERYLGEKSTFVFYPALESGVIKLLKGETEFTETEKIWFLASRRK